MVRGVPVVRWIERLKLALTVRLLWRAPATVAEVVRGFHATEADGVWPWLQARMQSQGLQVQSLRPQAVTTTDGLPQQAVSLQLQGRWHDWRALEAALNDPKSRDQFLAQGVESLPLGLEPFRRYCESEAARWGEVIRSAGLKIE